MGTEPRTPVRRAPLAVRTTLAWAYLIAAVGALRVVAAVGGWLPARALADDTLGLGNLAALGAVLAGVGLFSAVIYWCPSNAWRRVALAGLVAFHCVTLAVFPTRWLLGLLQTPETTFYFETDRPTFALTIDDGLDPVTTPAILDALARHDARATFFVLGESLAANGPLARRCVAAGHELANHQMADAAAVSLPGDELERQIRDADAALRGFAEPRWFRPGGGIETDVSRRVARDLGLRVALGSVFPFDSHVPSDRFAAAYVAGRVRPGDIVVLHDGQGRGGRTAAALDRALGGLAERGLRAVTLSELAPPR